MSHIYIFLTILFTVYGQLIIKWQMSLAGVLPELPNAKLIFLLKLLLNPWIMSGFLGAFIASLCWMVAVSKFPINYAYPFMSLSFVLVLLLSPVLFHEQVSTYKIIGMVLIAGGVIIGSQK